jgi:hypothetical protein
MARPIGSVEHQSELRIHIPEDWVIPKGKKRYVFTRLLATPINTLFRWVSKPDMYYDRYQQSMLRKRYNTKKLYGLTAINIDCPQNTKVPVLLRIIVGRGEDEIRTFF